MTCRGDPVAVPGAAGVDGGYIYIRASAVSGTLFRAGGGVGATGARGAAGAAGQDARCGRCCDGGHRRALPGGTGGVGGRGGHGGNGGVVRVEVSRLAGERINVAGGQGGGGGPGGPGGAGGGGCRGCWKVLCNPTDPFGKPSARWGAGGAQGDGGSAGDEGFVERIDAVGKEDALRETIAQILHALKNEGRIIEIVPPAMYQ